MARGPKAALKLPLRFAPGVPQPSPKLTDAAREEYVRVAELCRDAGRELQQVDAAVLEIYSQSWADYWRLDGVLRAPGALEWVETPNGFMQQHPAVKLREEAWKRLCTAAGKLGFSPADRARMGDKQKTKAQGFDPLAEFIG